MKIRASLRHKTRSARRAAGAAAVAALSAAACGGDSSGVPAPHVADVRISQESVVVELMDSARVTATVHMSDGSQAARSVEWTCTRPELVRACGPLITPRDTGTFGLVARVGTVADTAWIRIYEEGMREVTISDPSPGAPVWLLEGAGTVVKLQITDSTGAMRFDRRLRWSSSDTTVAVVRDTTWWNWNVGSWWPGGTVHVRSPGTSRLTITVGGKQATLDVVARPRAPACDAATAMTLDMAVGELRRFRGSDPDLPSCLRYRASTGGARYLVMFERLPATSASTAPGRRGLFVEGTAAAADSMVVQLYTPQAPAAQLHAARAAAGADMPARPAVADLHAHGHASWSIGGHHMREMPGSLDGGITEHLKRPADRGGAGGSAARPPQGAQTHGAQTHGAQAHAAQAALAAGDRLVISGLGSIGSTPGGALSDTVVVRYVGENLVFAEHEELFGTRLRRANGGASATIPQSEYQRIDAAAGPGRRQLDQLFGPAPGDSLLVLPPGRELIVNTILPAGVWGTWRRNMAIVDYWYGTDGTTPGLLQDPLLMANQLIIHELAHMRHFMHQPPQPTLLWTVEGVARFAEHLAFAAHLMKSDAPPRGGNIIAGSAGYPTDPHLRTQAELPSASALNLNFFGGYAASAYVFDYLADHAAARGGDALHAVREVVLASSSRTSANAAVALALGEPLSFDQLITRARLALVLDDHPDAVLPPWTQYLQYNVRASRPAVPNWPTALAGTPFVAVRPMAEGVAWGVFLDARTAVTDQDFLLDVTRGQQSVVSVVRVQ